MPAVLIDTNVLVYAHDPIEPSKQVRAIEVLDHLHGAGIGRLSVQTLAEFFAVVTRGPHSRLTSAQAARQVESLASSFPVFDVTSLVVIEAVRGVHVHRMSYWDAQLWAAARLNQTAVIFSEDFGAGAIIDGVRFVNPFSTNFILANWS